MMMTRNARVLRPTSFVLLAPFVFALASCGSESDLQTREQEGAGSTRQAQPAQDQRANFSKQKPGHEDEHGAPSTTTLVQWQLEAQTPKREPPAYNLAITLTVGGAQTAVEAGTAVGDCAIQQTHGELGRLRCVHAKGGNEFIVQKEGSGLIVYNKPYRTPSTDGVYAEPKATQVAKVALARDTNIEFRPEVLRTE